MKIAYICSSNGSELIDKEIGVYNKIKSQVQALEKYGIETQLKIIQKEPMWKTLVPFQTSSVNWKKIIAFSKEYDGLYLRYNCSDYQMIKIFRSLKRENRNFKIVIEIPTYPYDAERKKRYRYYRDVRYRNKLHTCVDRIVSFSRDTKIWGIPVIRTHNGIDLLTVKKRQIKSRDDIIHICFIANFANHHGLDRVIEGLYHYYKEGSPYKIILHVVGNVPQNIIDSLKHFLYTGCIRDKIIFHGRLVGEKLDDMYDKCNLAIASLGIHRLGISWLSTLKSREYLAKGIPFIYSGTIDVFAKNPVDFALQIPADDTPADFHSILSFYRNLYKKYSEEELCDRIRKYAEKYVSMFSAMKLTAEYFCNGKVRV